MGPWFLIYEASKVKDKSTYPFPFLL